MSDNVIREEGFMIFQDHPAHGFRPQPVFCPDREGAESLAARFLERDPLPLVVLPVVRFITADAASGKGVPFR